jgi:hypothetical protein
MARFDLSDAEGRRPVSGVSEQAQRVNDHLWPVSSIGQRNTYLDGRTWSDEDEEKV